MLEQLKQSPLLRAACGTSVRYTGLLDEVAYWPPRRMTADERSVLMYERVQFTEVTFSLDIHRVRRYRDACLEAAPRLRAAEYRQKTAQLDSIQERQWSWLAKYGW
jgi:hypothetical protein